MRTKNEPNSEAMRKKVLLAAIRCFAEVGLQKSSISQISRKSGMRSGHIYYYFKSKEEIIEAAYTLGTDAILARTEQLLDKGDISDAIIGLHLEAEHARREYNITPALRLEFAAETSRNPRLRRIQKEWSTQLRAAQERAVERAIAAGRLDPDLNPRAFARAMTIIWSGLGTLRVEQGFDEAAYRSTVAMLLAPWLRDVPQIAEDSTDLGKRSTNA